mgnify:CR=1 FL=1
MGWRVSVQSAGQTGNPHEKETLTNEKKPLMLMIMDGFGFAPAEGNAIKAANTPNLDKLFSENPLTQIGASGMDVGLPDGQMGKL